jgi:hypothetical protein
MKLKEIVKKANTLGIEKPEAMRKAELIHAIQEKEGNSPCYATAKNGRCDQKGCLWYGDCMDDSGSFDLRV